MTRSPGMSRRASLAGRPAHTPFKDSPRGSSTESKVLTQMSWVCRLRFWIGYFERSVGLSRRLSVEPRALHGRLLLAGKLGSRGGLALFSQDQRGKVNLPERRSEPARRVVPWRLEFAAWDGSCRMNYTFRWLGSAPSGPGVGLLPALREWEPVLTGWTVWAILRARVAFGRQRSAGTHGRGLAADR